MEKKKVLIVDDEKTIRHLLCSILGKEYIVLEAKDGEQAVHMAGNQQPDLILLDIMMPKMDGYTACSAIKTNQLTKAIPVVMLTGVDHELNKKLAKEIGADGYITKPFARQDILNVISRFLINPDQIEG